MAVEIQVHIGARAAVGIPVQVRVVAVEVGGKGGRADTARGKAADLGGEELEEVDTIDAGDIRALEEGAALVAVKTTAAGLVMSMVTRKRRGIG